ncbi:MAG: hypothetical protein ACXW3X_07685 [Rhodoplanes sp.]
MTNPDLATKAAAAAKVAAELAADEEAEIINEIQAEEELWSEWNAPPRARDEDDEELDAAFWEAMEKDGWGGSDGEETS